MQPSYAVNNAPPTNNGVFFTPDVQRPFSSVVTRPPTVIPGFTQTLPASSFIRATQTVTVSQAQTNNAFANTAGTTSFFNPPSPQGFLGSGDNQINGGFTVIAGPQPQPPPQPQSFPQPPPQPFPQPGPTFGQFNPQPPPPQSPQPVFQPSVVPQPTQLPLLPPPSPPVNVPAPPILDQNDVEEAFEEVPPNVTPPPGADPATLENCYARTCDQLITGRDLTYARALEIIQGEDYITEADLEGILRRKKRQQTTEPTEPTATTTFPNISICGLNLFSTSTTAVKKRKRRQADTLEGCLRIGLVGLPFLALLALQQPPPPPPPAPLVVVAPLPPLQTIEYQVEPDEGEAPADQPQPGDTINSTE